MAINASMGNYNFTLVVVSSRAGDQMEGRRCLYPPVRGTVAHLSTTFKVEYLSCSHRLCLWVPGIFVCV